MRNPFWRFAWGLGACVVLAHPAARGQTGATDPTVRDLAEQNQALQKKVDTQQQEIDELRGRLDQLQKASTTPAPAPLPEAPASAPAESFAAASDHPIRISGETGLAFFSGGQDGAYPNSEFSVDDAKIFVEAPVWHDIFFYGELDLATREGDDDYFHLGEIYLDMEDVLSAGRDRQLSLRIGRFNIPFGEEYQNRDVMANPLITHSVSDIWGYDTGVQAYGSLGEIQYNLAVQNGGEDKNKAVTARLGYNPVRNLHLSVSAHNTGRLDVANDFLSQIWFGGAFFRGLPQTPAAHAFDVGLYEFDATWKWNGGHAGAAAGLARFTDDNPLADDTRRLRYFSVEAAQDLVGNLSGAVRYSEVRVPGGYPLAGEGNSGKYFFSPAAPLTTGLQRISLGLDYRFGAPFIWKVEYSWEHGHLAGGTSRNDEDLLSTEIGIHF